MKMNRLLVACGVAVLPLVSAFAEEGGAKKLVDNEVMSVMEITMKPGQKSEGGGHGNVAAYFLTDAKFKMTGADGASKDYSFKAGEAAWFPAKNETAVNTGDADFKLVATTIKKPGNPPPAGGDPHQVGPDIYKQILANDQVRVYEITFKPGAKIGMHAHPSHTAYILEGTKLHIAPEGVAGQDFDIAPGAAMFMDSVAHAAHNPSDKTTKAVVFEAKPAK